MGLWSCTRLRAAWKEITDAEFSLWIMFALLIYLQCRWKLWNSGEVHVLIQVFLKQTNCKQLLDIQSLQVALLMRWVKPWNIFRAWHLFQLSRIIYPLLLIQVLLSTHGKILSSTPPNLFRFLLHLFLVFWVVSSTMQTTTPWWPTSAAAAVTLTLGKTKTSDVTSVGAWPPTTAAVALPPPPLLLTDDGLLQDVPAAEPLAPVALTAASTKKFASSICRRRKQKGSKLQQFGALRNKLKPRTSSFFATYICVTKNVTLCLYFNLHCTIV